MTPKVYPQEVGLYNNFDSPREDWAEIKDFFDDNVWSYDWTSELGMIYTHGNKGLKQTIKEYDKGIFD